MTKLIICTLIDTYLWNKFKARKADVTQGLTSCISTMAGIANLIV